MASSPEADAIVASLPIVDAHHHVWDLSLKAHPWLTGTPLGSFRYGDYAAIRRSYLPADYRRDAARANVVKSVYVETEWNDSDPIGETRWVHETATREAAARPQDARRGAPGSMDCRHWRDGFALLAKYGLHFDLQTPWWHLDAAAELAKHFPATTIILNHAGLPSDRSADGLAAWRSAMERLVSHANVMVKVSGLGVPGRLWTAELQRPVVRDVIAVFGAERVMFASNYPVDSLVATFDEIYGSFLEITRNLPEVVRRQLFHDNAVRIYRL
jgi:predicted TIM-barrel fold metal-dependent hydrolase